jgi:hypothetical protein
MKIRLWIGAHPNHFLFSLTNLVSRIPKTLFLDLTYPFPCG